MRKAACFCAALALLGGWVALAQGNEHPRWPRPPVGFDEGKTELLDELDSGSLDADDLLERLFEDADLDEISAFVAIHLKADERAALDTILDLDGGLKAPATTDSVKKVFEAHKLKARSVATGLGKVLRKREYDASDAAAWLYARDFNCPVMSRAAAGERGSDAAFRAELRVLQAKEKGADRLFEKGLWEFDLRDGREIPGGHYDGVQLAEDLLELGWDAELWSKALDCETVRDLPEEVRTTLEWRDPVLLWQALELRIPESDLCDFAEDWYKKQERQGVKSPKVFEHALLRTRCTSRWLRTAGPGVLGVYEGPWPSATDSGKAPTAAAMEMEADDLSTITDSLRQWFRGASGPRLTLVIYEDGSARAMLANPGQSWSYAADTPPGQRSSSALLYEGVFSTEGKSAVLGLVFSPGGNAGPAEIELSNLILTAEGAMIVADRDDGKNLYPLLLRRRGRVFSMP